MLRICIVFKPLNPLNNLLWLGGINIFLLLQVRKLRLKQWHGTWIQMVCSRAHTSLQPYCCFLPHTPRLPYSSLHKVGHTGWGYEDSLVEDSLNTAQSPLPRAVIVQAQEVPIQMCHGYVREQGLVSCGELIVGHNTQHVLRKSHWEGSTRHNYQSFLLKWNGTDTKFQETPHKVNGNQVIFWIQTSTSCLQALLLGSKTPLQFQGTA